MKRRKLQPEKEGDRRLGARTRMKVAAVRAIACAMRSKGKGVCTVCRARWMNTEGKRKRRMQMLRKACSGCLVTQAKARAVERRKVRKVMR